MQNLWINFKFFFLRILQQVHITPIYFQYPLFKLDVQFFKRTCFQNPYRICRKFFENSHQKGVYGNTWPFVAPHLVKALSIGPEDVIYEVGSGTGRFSCWLQVISGAEVFAIEKVPTFQQTARSIKKKLNLKRIHFIEEDCTKVDYSKASVIYFYSSSFSQEVIKGLIEKWKLLKNNVMIVTTSFELNEFLASSDFELLDSYKVSYPWGTCMMHVQQLKKAVSIV